MMSYASALKSRAVLRPVGDENVISITRPRQQERAAPSVGSTTPARMLGIATALASGAAATTPVLSGKELYDALYASGYHGLRNHTRAHELLSYLADTNRTANLGVRSVLDVGCSHGYAVSALWTAGYVASGVDLSTVAIDRARQIRGNGSCVQRCFAQGSATAIPWPTHAFDAIMSSDVLEHVEPADVPAAVTEISRVASRLLVLKIAAGGDQVDAKQHRLFNQGALAAEI